MFLFYPKSAAGVLRQEIQRADGLPSHNNQITASRMNGPDVWAQYQQHENFTKIQPQLNDTFLFSGTE